MQPVITDDLVVALVTGCQRGESSAMEKLYDLYADRLYRYLLARVGDADVAADLTMDVFLRVIKAIGAFRLNRERPAATVSAWLYRIAANLAGEYFRGQKHTALLDEVSDISTAEEIDPHALAVQREEAAKLADALAKLSEEQRLVITGKFLENMSNAEVAAWLGKSEGAVKSLQHRALKSLARFMSNDA